MARRGLLPVPGRLQVIISSLKTFRSVLAMRWWHLFQAAGLTSRLRHEVTEKKEKLNHKERKKVKRHQSFQTSFGYSLSGPREGGGGTGGGGGGTIQPSSNLWNSSRSPLKNNNNIIIRRIMYLYYALINALSAHAIHINLNMIFSGRAQSYQNNLHQISYGKTNKHTCGTW